MAKSLDEYADDLGPVETDFPDGKYLDESGGEPGTSIKADGKNQIYYFFAKLMDSVSLAFNGTLDNFTTSQFFTALTTRINNLIDAFYDQDLNTTNDVEFNSVTTDDINVDTIIGNTGTGVSIQEVNGAQVLTKIIDIGDWNMLANSSVSIAHGLDPSELDNIRRVTAHIRADSGLLQYTDLMASNSAGNPPAGNIIIDSTNYVLQRDTGGLYDSASYDSTSYNRGWMIVTYII